MKCRNVDKNNNLVWFGKTGVKDYVKVFRNDVVQWFGFNWVDVRTEVGQPPVELKVGECGFYYRMGMNILECKVDSENIWELKYTWDNPQLDEEKQTNATLYNLLTNKEVGKMVWMNAPIENYASGTEAIKCSLIQRLSVIKGELWYQINHGIPLTEKYKSKGIYDSSIIDIISSHKGVKGVRKFISYIKDGIYYFEADIVSIYNEEFSMVSKYNF